MRGKHRSVPLDQLVAEAQELEARGVVELNLISQDTTWYGRDLVRGLEGLSDGGFVGRLPESAVRSIGAIDSEHRHGLLVPLLSSLLAQTNIPWFRLFYMYPSGIHRPLVQLMAEQPRILPYLDMPIQHGSDRMLTLMRRPERRSTILERVSWLREALPDLSLRTTVIVGFPGETEEDFRALLDLLQEVRFDYLGGFPYSVEEDTAAATMPDQVPDALKRERLEELLDVQRSITGEKNEAHIGSTMQVLIDRVTGRDSMIGSAEEPRGAIGRTRGQALEVDGVVHIANAQGLRPGDFASVRIVDAVEYDLLAELNGSGA
jgi:ribosomal protein S12 methylthiotransferase